LRRIKSERKKGEQIELKSQNTTDLLIEISKRIIAETELSNVLDLSLDHAIEITGAERGLIIMFEKGGEILIEAARNLKKEDIENPQFEISRTIINKVRVEQKPVWFRNALKRTEIQKSRSAFRLKILSVICLPLVHKNELFGVVYLDNRSVSGAFNEEIFHFTESFADFISLATYNALGRQTIQKRQQILEQQLRTHYDFDAIIGQSPKMLEVLELISQVADTDVPVLIEGETGTGKELVARAIHFNSQRKDKPLICINCGALPENLLESELFGYERGAFTGAFQRYRGKFEQADGGTMFLDEVDMMSPALQVKLLRILQWGEFNPLRSEETKKCNVRIVAAAKQPLQNLVNKGLFRDDLYYRLNLIRLTMPSLKERKEDILLLANYFLNMANQKLSKSISGFNSKVQQLLQHYDYPGNVRELENIIKRTVILCQDKEIDPTHLPGELSADKKNKKMDEAIFDMSFQEAKKLTIEEFEKKYLHHILEKCNGNIRQAAQRCAVYEGNSHAKLKKYNITAKMFKAKNRE